jgi:hypothetical protein
MDEEKQSEASAEKPERLGPYVLQEQVEQSHDSPVELYLATHETTGATALVRKHAEEEGTAPGKEWRVSLGSSSEGYSAMEVEHTDWATARDTQSAESLLLTLEGVREEVGHMARVLSDTHAPRFRWRLGLGVASAAAVCALLLALVRLAPVSPPPSAPHMSHEEHTANEKPDTPTYGDIADTADAGHSVLARPLPKEPFKDQKRPPCNRHVETELVGACWLQHVLMAPCPDQLYEYEGKCYSPTIRARPPPSSLAP